MSAMSGAGSETEPAVLADVILVDRRVEDLNQISNALPGVPVVVMSNPGKSSLATTRLYRGRLLKPVRPARLYAVLARCLLPDGLGLAIDGAPAGAMQPAALNIPTRPVTRHVEQPEALRILVAEDNLTNQRVLQLILSQLGYHSDVANDGLQVMEALTRKVYDVILMDMQMPGLDGLETTRLVRDNLPAERQPRIIAMTANVMQGDRERCLEAGMNDYLSKPVRNYELNQALLACHALAASEVQDEAPGILAAAPEVLPAAPGILAGAPDILAEAADILPAAEVPPGADGQESGEDLLDAIRAEIRVQPSAPDVQSAAAPKVLPGADQPETLESSSASEEELLPGTAGWLEPSAQDVLPMAPGLPAATAERAPRAAGEDRIAPDDLLMRGFASPEAPRSEPGTASVTPTPTPAQQEAPPLQPGAIDREMLDSMIFFLGGDGHALVTDVVHIFSRTTPDIIQQMDTALHRADLLTVQQAAHSLKSSSATLGATRLSQCASQLEIAARDARAIPNSATQPMARYEVMLDQLRAEFSRADAELKDMGY
jgi:CheY-like chemotaxis protein/HPt (histidine-containing phosphotransfer) domain-containing protein